MIFSSYFKKKWEGIGNIQAFVIFFLPGRTEQDNACLEPG